MSKKQSKIKYLDLWGLREEKYKFLETHNVKNTKWQDLESKEPYYWFVPKDTRGEEKYQKFIFLKDIFEKFGSGVITRRDEFAIADNQEELKRRIKMFLDKNLSKEMIVSLLKIDDTYEWNLEQARDILRKDKNLDKKYFEYFYRPFDKRWIIYHENLVSRPSALLRQCFPNHDNLGLICSRKTPINVNFNHAFVSSLLSDIHSAADQSYIFPLYIYNEAQQRNLEILDRGMPKANFSQAFWDRVKDIFIQAMSPLDLFYYIYGILYSNIYRKKYNEFLKIDFPKIPFSKNDILFHEISGIGKELVDLHLLKSKKLEKVIAKFPVSTGNILKDNRVEKRNYNEKEKRIYINEKQYFENVGLEVWNYYIGGYQVLDKWLKDRIGRVLSPEDVNHYLKVITAIKYTIDLQKQIDKIYPEVEKSLIK